MISLRVSEEFNLDVVCQLILQTASLPFQVVLQHRIYDINLIHVSISASGEDKQ